MFEEGKKYTKEEILKLVSEAEAQATVNIIDISKKEGNATSEQATGLMLSSILAYTELDRVLFSKGKKENETI